MLAPADLSYPDTTSLPILLGKANFVSWNRSVTTMLYGGGWWPYVCDPRVPEPNMTFDPEREPVFAPQMPDYGIAATAAQILAHTNWVRGDAVALHIITSRLDNPISNLIPGPFGPHGRTTARDAWKILNREFNLSSAHTSVIKSDLKRTRLGTDMDLYIRIWNEARISLYNANDPMRDDESIRGFLDGLPRTPEWRSFFDWALDRLEDDPLGVTFKEVTERARWIATRDNIRKCENILVYTNIDKTTTNPFIPRAKPLTCTAPGLNPPDITMAATPRICGNCGATGHTPDQ